MIKKTIVIADDHDLIRNGVRVILGKQKNLQIVGEARNGREAIALYQSLKPDLLIVDISMPIMNGMEVAKDILEQHPNANIIVLSMYDDVNYVSTCLEIGVKGFVVKSESGDELGDAVESVLNDRIYFSRQAQSAILNRYKQTIGKTKVATPGIVLTPREIEVVKLISIGLTSYEISEKLFISQRTVETHRANLLKKLGVKNAIELVKKSEQLNLLV